MCMVGRIFKEGVLASLSGGLYFDQSLGHFIWVVHLLLWLFFFTLPVVITVLSPTSLVAWASYSCVVTLIVSCILYWTYHLHKEFDKIDPVVRNNKSYKLLEDTERITLTGHDSDLSLDVHQISASHDICSPVVDVEEQCRQLGLASLRIADFNVHTGVSCGNVNPITLHPHPETSTINARTDFNEFSRPEAAANSLILHSIRRSPTLNQSFTSPENALTPCDATLAISLSKTCLRVNSSLSEDKLGRNQAHIFQPHIHRTDKCQVLTPEVEATSKQSQGSSSTSKTVDESDDDAFREIFLRHVNQVASDFNVPRCSSSIRRGSSNSAPSICFLGTRSIYNRRKVRSEVLLRHPLDTPANSQRCLKELSTCLSPEEAFTTSYGCPEVETTPAPEATTSFGGCEIISKMGSDLFGVPLLCEDGVDVKAELKLQLGVNAVVSPSSQITVPAPSTSVYRVSCTNFGNFEEVVLLPSKAQPLSPVSSTQVNSKETSSVSNRSPSVSRRRRTHHAQTPFPPPNATLTVTSIPTCASRDVRKTGPEEHGTHHVAISPRSRLPYSRPFISRRRLLTFPPDLNSLDLAYFLPLTSDDGVGNAPGPVSTTVRMHNCSPRWEIPRKDANVSVVQEPIQPRRSKSLGSQPDPTFRSSQQSSPTASIDRMIRGISHGDCLPTSLSPPSLRSETADVTAVEGSDSVESRYQTSSDRGTDLTNQPEEVASTSHNSQPSVFPVVRFSSRGRARQRNVSRGDFQYRVRLFPFWRRRFLIDFNRLQLIALFDRKSTVLEYLMTLALTILVSVLGSLLLSCGAFHGFGLTCFCYVLAGCHYSLIKSVQPDPASPLHGFNRLIVYSRSSVFCCLCALFAVSVLLIGGDDGGRRDACPSNFYFVRRYEAHLSAWPSHYEGIVNSQSPTLTLYGLSLQPLWLLCLLKDASGYLLLSFPLIFLFGLVPQINTLLAYILEQVDVHVFGASGSANLTSAALSVVRSVVVIAICFGFCHAAVNKCNPQSFFLSLFWGLHLAMCFMMSRTPNNVNIFHLLWTRMVSDAPAPPLRTQLLSCISSPVSFISRHRLNRSCVSLLLRRCLMSLQSLFTAKTIARGTTVAKEDEGGVETPLSPACCVTETSRQCDQQTQSSVSPVEPGNTEKPLSSPGAPTTLQSQPRLTSPEFPGPSPRPSSPNSPLGDVSTAPQTVSAPGSSRVPGPNVPSPSSTPPLSNAMTSDLHDPLPDRIVSAMVVRIHNDLLVMLIWFILGSAVHLSTVFTVPALQPGLPRVLTWLTIVWGFILHYVWPQLRKPFPWLLFTRTVFARPPDGRLTAFEVAYYWCHWLERYLLVPAVTMASVTQALAPLLAKFGKVWTTIILLITTMKLLRNGFSGATKMFLVLFFAEVLFTCDFPGLSETLPVDYFFLSIIISKIEELWNKLSFVYIYTAPFQASWGSICHAVAQLASIPHFVSILGNCVFSTLISAPLEPFVGSVFFITSYVRPIRFWEATQSLGTPVVSAL
uniref:Pecanex-like protein n=1 Tax=Mesocestoides corti TaxID=53468 RepID=A0A5K3EZY9_MESCO